ncbi:MAG TPA: YbaK/EbsC family protein [Candidatus Methylomirabilis sp.]|nr:YbaK/EbsC family protein [Candidatus Methylomirabilis sp.]
MIPEKVSRLLSTHGIQAIEFEPGSTATSQLAAGQLGVLVGQIAKSLLFLGRDGRYFMLLCPGDRKVSSSKLKAALGVKTRMARYEETLAATGFEPGGVCPFGVDERIQILIDESLAQYQTIYPAAGTSASGVPMTFEQLVSITGGQVGDFMAAEEAEEEKGGAGEKE